LLRCSAWIGRGLVYWKGCRYWPTSRDCVTLGIFAFLARAFHRNIVTPRSKKILMVNSWGKDVNTVGLSCWWYVEGDVVQGSRGHESCYFQAKSTKKAGTTTQAFPERNGNYGCYFYFVMLLHYHCCIPDELTCLIPLPFSILSLFSATFSFKLRFSRSSLSSLQGNLTSNLAVNITLPYRCRK